VNKTLTNILSDIRFWIILFFVIRLIGITNPPLEISHNWRQTTVTMVARNFLEIDNTIFYPRVDFAGEKTGITGMEFPLFNYLIYLTSELFGYQHWYGRLINLLFSSLGIWFYYKLVKKYFNNKLAFNSSIILLFSIWFSFSRKIMPDTFSMSLVIVSIYYGYNYLYKKGTLNQSVNLLMYAILFCIGALSKLPSAYAVVLFTIPFFNFKISIQRKFVFAAVSIIGFLPVLFWYFYWFPYLIKTYNFFHFSMGKGLLEGAKEINSNLPLVFNQFYSNAIKYIGFIVFLYAIIQLFRKKEKKILYVFVLSFLSYLVIILKAGNIFIHHNYYIIPFVPIISLIAGYGITTIKIKKIGITLLMLIAFEGILNQQHDFYIKKNALVLLKLEEDLNKFSSPKDLILVNSNECPTPMYFSHRKGWLASNFQLKQKNYIKNLKENGLRYIVILKKKYGNDIDLNYKIVSNNKDYKIYLIY